MLSAYVDESGSNWDMYLQLVTFAYNTSVQASTNFSPFYVLFGREATVPMDLALEIPKKIIVNSDLSIYMQENLRNLKKAWQFVSEILSKAKEKQKEFYDEHRNTKLHDIRAQDLVMIYKTFIKKNNKFKTHWQGPYRVIAVQRPDVIVKEVKGGKENVIKIHLNKVKKFIGPFTLPLRKADEPIKYKKIFLDKNIEESDDGDTSDGENSAENLQTNEQRTPKKLFLDQNLEQSDEELQGDTIERE